MKIFAKRKRTVVETEPSKVKENETNKKFESDEIVKELLKQNPSTWNAKQRRLIKRYNERNPNEATDPPPSSIEEPSNLQMSLVASRAGENEGGKEEEEDGHEESDASDDDAHENGDDDDDDDVEDQEEEDDEEEDGENSIEDETKLTMDDKTYPPEGDEISKIDSATKESDTLPIDPTESSFTEQPQNESNSSIDDALKDLLDKLNSKQRRTLMRQYDRDQDIEHLRNEAARLLQENEQAAKESQSATIAVCDEVIEPVTKKRRRRGPVVDESKLSPEERIRREEQRRLQALARASNHNNANVVTDDTEVASAARTTGTVQPKHRHPLNSERRRANRRKPKWEVTSHKKKFPPNEHDTSGYHMRKVTKGPSLPE
jgi:hypothetical protein